MTREEKIHVLGNLCATTSCYNCKFKEVCRAEKEVTDKWPEHALDRALRAAGLDPETSEKIADQKEVKETTGMTREEKLNIVEGICNREPCSSECRFKDICDNTPYLLEDWPDVALDQCLRRIGIDPETGEKIADQKEVKETTGMTREEKIKMVKDICHNQGCNTCTIKSVCDQTTDNIEDWTDDMLDECLSFADIDPETGEKITAIPDIEESCPPYEDLSDDELDELAQLAEEPAQDVVNHPQHYELPNGLECIDAMVATLGRETVMAFCKANAFKYLWRHERKNGAEDVEKARWYLNKWHELREDGETA